MLVVATETGIAPRTRTVPRLLGVVYLAFGGWFTERPLLHVGVLTTPDTQQRLLGGLRSGLTHEDHRSRSQAREPSLPNDANDEQYDAAVTAEY